MTKVDSQGKEVWNRTFGNFDNLNSILPTTDGGCIVVIDASLIKIDADGLEKAVHKESKSTDTQSSPGSGQNTHTREEAPEETPINAKESPLPLSIGAISLIVAVFFMKSRRDRL